jgi:hypothetical protein
MSAIGSITKLVVCMFLSIITLTIVVVGLGATLYSCIKYGGWRKEFREFGDHICDLVDTYRKFAST